MEQVRTDMPWETLAMCGSEASEETVEMQSRRLGISIFNQSDKGLMAEDIF